MRERIQKGNIGQNNTGRKEVRIKVIKAGLNADGSQRYSLSMRFVSDSIKKVSKNGYTAVEIDRDLQRLYFIPAEPDEGFKFTGKKTDSIKSIAFTISECDEWKIVEGCYYLLKDMTEGIYYIDYSKH